MKTKTRSLTAFNVIRVFRMVHGFGGMIVASTAIRAASKASTIVLAMLIAKMLEQAILESLYSVQNWLCFLLGAFILTIVFSYADTYVSHRVSFNIVKQLQDRTYGHIDKIAPGGLAGINSADSATLILSDISVFEWFVAHCLVEWGGTFITLFICLQFIGKISVPAAIAVFLLLVLMMAVPLFSSKQANEKGLVMKQLFGQLNGIVADGVSGSKDILAFHWTKPFFQRLNHASGTYAQVQKKYALRSECERSVEALLACLAVLSGLLFAADSVENPAQLLSIFALCAGAAVCIQDTLGESTNFGFVFGAAGRIVKILDRPAPVQDDGRKGFQDVAMEPQTWTLTVDHVKFQYRDEASDMLLQDISFEVNGSETVAIVAASGGGKSTMAKLLQRFWDVSDGSIRINHTDIRELKLTELRDLITVVPQETYLFHGSIWDNLMLVKPDATEADIHLALRLTQAQSFIDRLKNGIHTQVGEKGVMLSGGERQRIALTQAFLKNTPILVLDEATSALDEDNEMHINEAIKKYRKGKITIVIAHRLSSIKSADRIVFIKDGAVHQCGTYAKLIQSCEAFQELVRGEYYEDKSE